MTRFILVWLASLASVAIIARVDAEASLDQQEDCDTGSSLHLLQKSAAVVKQHNLVTGDLNQSLKQSTQVSMNATAVYTIHELAEKIKQAQLDQAMNPFVYTPLLSIDAVTVSVPVVAISMSWYNYVLSGVVAFSLLGLLWIALGPCCVGENHKHGDDESESEDDLEVAKYLGLFLSIVDGNDWMMYTFFPSWLVARGLSTEQGLLCLAWNGIGILIGVPFGYYIVSLVAGGPPMAVWICNRLYALSRLYFIALIFVPTVILFYAACFGCFLAGVLLCANEIGAQSWCILSVGSDKRIKALGYMQSARMLGSIFGPGIGGVFYSLGGLCLPFAVGFVMLIAAQEYGKSFFLQASEQNVEKQQQTRKGISDASNFSKPVDKQGNTGKGQPRSILLKLPCCLLGAGRCYFALHDKQSDGETLRDKQLDIGNGDKIDTVGVKSGSILFSLPILICFFAMAVEWTCLVSVIMWQQLWMSAQYGLPTWQFGLYMTFLMVVLTLWIVIAAINVTQIMNATAAMVISGLIMGSGYVLMDSPLLPFISHTSVWMGMIGTLILILGLAVQLTVVGAFIPSYAIGCGWEPEEAALQTAAYGVAVYGIACFIGPGTAGILIKAIGIPSMCTAFAILCFGTAVILSPLYSVQSTAGDMKELS